MNVKLAACRAKGTAFEDSFVYFPQLDASRPLSEDFDTGTDDVVREHAQYAVGVVEVALYESSYFCVSGRIVDSTRCFMHRHHPATKKAHALAQRSRHLA